MSPSKDPKGGCLDIFLPWAQLHLDYGAREWSKAHEQVYLWMAQKTKQNEGSESQSMALNHVKMM